MDYYMNQVEFATLPTAFTGFLINWTVCYSFLYLKSMKHSFGLLSANQALADALHSTTFLLYYCPMVLLDSQILKDYSRHCGFMTLFSFELSIASHFVISINRFCAIWIPLDYQSIFSFKNTKLMLLIMWIIVGSSNITMFQFICQITYSEISHSIAFPKTELCQNIRWYGDFLKNTILALIFMLLDIITVMKVRRSRLSVNTSRSDTKSISEREKRFLKQAVAQGSMCLLELSSYYTVPKLTDNRIIIFFGTLFAFVLLHVMDGIIVLLCNPEIRAFIFCGKKGSVVSSVVKTHPTNQTITIVE